MRQNDIPDGSESRYSLHILVPLPIYGKYILSAVALGGVAVKYLKRLRSQRSTDVRVLRSQLDLTSQTVRSSRLSSPFWALAIAWLGSESCGLFGNVNFNTAVFVPVIVSATMILSASVVSIYQYDTAENSDYERTRPWFTRIVAMQASISIAWGLMPWLLWTPNDPVNHLFLGGVTLAIQAMLVVSRSSHMDMFLASLIPITLMASLRFLTGGTPMDTGFAIVIPVFAAQLLVDGRRLMHRLDEDSRLRFQVEDMAREIEITRDDALRKRFEAETANASKTAFLANMSHELRTPLNAILGFSEVMIQQMFGPLGASRYMEYSRLIHESGSHLLELINSVLDLSKIEAGKLEIMEEAFDLNDCVDQVLHFVRIAAERAEIHLVIDIDPAAAEVFADRRAVGQMLINLFSNAVKYTPAGGEVCLTARRREKGIEIAVSDTGTGIAPADIRRLGKPFEQTRSASGKEGTGLGLALVKAYAQLHGGEVILQSVVGVGTTVRLIFPRGACAGSTATSAAPEGLRTVA